MDGKPQLGTRFIFAACILTVGLSLVAGDRLQPDRRSPSTEKARLKEFLRIYDTKLRDGDDRPTTYAAASVDLRDDGKHEVVVYVMGDVWCGSGGCSCLILEPKDSSFAIVTKMTVTRTPIRVLVDKTNGWHDLAVGVGGGGIRDGYEARLRFNGRKYPSNPTVPPAERLTKKVEGKVVIPAYPKGEALESPTSNP